MQARGQKATDATTAAAATATEEEEEASERASEQVSNLQQATNMWGQQAKQRTVGGDFNTKMCSVLVRRHHGSRARVLVVKKWSKATRRDPGICL